VAGAPDEFIEGESEVIEYDGKADNVRFITRAEMRRYRESVVTDELSGAVIVYNNLTDVFTVDGQKKAAASGAGDAPAAGGRCVPCCHPKSSLPAPPLRPMPQAGPCLRPSNSLGGASK
jgi:lipopolysaccharide export system protein LptA